MTSRPTTSVFQSSSPSNLPERFLQQGQYLRNWSATTLRTLRQGLNSLSSVVHDDPPTKANLEAWVIGLRQKGLTPGGCNMYIRTVNSYARRDREPSRTPQTIPLIARAGPDGLFPTRLFVRAHDGLAAGLWRFLRPEPHGL